NTKRSMIELMFITQAVYIRVPTGRVVEQEFTLSGWTSSNRVAGPANQGLLARISAWVALSAFADG
ncbi:MAG TPA: hypothetical protein VII95_07765, partial [Terriglobales bacterium]